MPTYDVPGVYIEEVTGPGVIAGVSTSTAAFIGPALTGPLGVAQKILSYDDFLRYYGVLNPDGSRWPYITSPRWFYLAHGVQKFFENGGAQAYIVRVGTAKNTTWKVSNQNGDVVFVLRAKQEGPSGDLINIAVNALSYTGAGGMAAANPTATVTTASNLQLTVNNASGFRVGDTITDGTAALATITNIQGNVITTSVALTGTNLRIADVGPPPNTFPIRMQSTAGLFPGTVAQIKGFDAANNPVPAQYVVIQSVDQVGFVTLAASPGLTNTYSLAAATPPVLVSSEFQIVITPPVGSAETWPSTPANAGLSLSPLHPEYVFSVLQSNYVDILPPDAPPTAGSYPGALVSPQNPLTISVNGVADNPASLASTDYHTALDLLRDIQDVDLLCIPDAAGYTQLTAVTIQQDMIAHCTLKGDRFAILDSLRGAPQTGPGSVSEQRASVPALNGFAALYYPWLSIVDPTWKPSPTNAIPATMNIPPSGAIAGVYARIDNAPGGGVHKAPANTYVAGVVGLEARLSDRQQGPLNLAGIDVLRIFPGSGQVTVWGARTTGDPNTTDWIYVNVRRLMIYIEQSIEQGIRWAVFEPNNLSLWQKLKRTITEFLTRLWQDGALFGATAAQAFYVRIDEALNPPSTRALGRLYIEIGVAPVRPAEFIIVRIGLWDGGAQVTES